MRKFEKPLKHSEIRAIRDEDIDYSDIAELDETFWNHAQLVKPDRMTQITRSIRRLVPNFLRALVRRFESRSNRL